MKDLRNDRERAAAVEQMATLENLVVTARAAALPSPISEVECDRLGQLIDGLRRDIAWYDHHRLADASTPGAKFRAVYVLHVLCGGDRTRALRQTPWAEVPAGERPAWEAAAGAYEPNLGQFEAAVCVVCYAVEAPCAADCPHAQDSAAR